MSTNYRQGIPLEEAVSILLSHTRKITRTEVLPLLSARGRILAQDIISPINNPPFDRSPIDGYACHAADLAGASRETPARLRVVEEVDAGGYSTRQIQPGEAVRIMTGAPIPAGCDCCLRQENTDYGEDMVEIYAPEKPHSNYCDAGEDFSVGTCLVSAGEKLTAIELANLAAMGQAMVPVYALPQIALFTTGDELIAPGQALHPGGIYNSNLTLLAARLLELGFPPVCMAHLSDEPTEVARAMEEAVSQGADLILTTGGVSVGKKDILHEALPLLGAQKHFWRVKLKPGTPTIFSTYRDVPIVSLSGNPFGALANLELLVRPMLAKLTGDAALVMPSLSATLAEDFPKASPGRRFIRARFDRGSVYLPQGLHSSGVLASMKGCNCLIDIPAASPALSAGTRVRVRLLATTEPSQDNASFAAATEQDNASFPATSEQNDANFAAAPSQDDTSFAASPGKDNSNRKQATEPCKQKLLCISGIKNSGKTTLITRLIPLLRERGISVATIKHDGHAFDPDVPDTDSYRHRQAGAVGTAIFSPQLSMVIKKESTNEGQLIAHFPQADLILLEGFKWTAYPKIEVVREGNSAAPVCDPQTLVAIATDKPDTRAFPEGIPRLSLTHPEEIVDFLCATVLFPKN